MTSFNFESKLNFFKSQVSYLNQKSPVRFFFKLANIQIDEKDI